MSRGLGKKKEGCPYPSSSAVHIQCSLASELCFPSYLTLPSLETWFEFVRVIWGFRETPPSHIHGPGRSHVDGGRDTTPLPDEYGIAQAQGQGGNPSQNTPRLRQDSILRALTYGVVYSAHKEKSGSLNSSALPPSIQLLCWWCSRRQRCVCWGLSFNRGLGNYMNVSCVSIVAPRTVV